MMGCGVARQSPHPSVNLCSCAITRSRIEAGARQWLASGHRDEIAEQSIRQQVVRYSLRVRKHSWVPVALSQIKKLSPVLGELSLFA